jgi:hypothetical protein
MLQVTNKFNKAVRIPQQEVKEIHKVPWLIKHIVIKYTLKITLVDKTEKSLQLLDLEGSEDKMINFRQD